MIIITTSRKPSRRTRRFCRELEGVLPLSKYVNRGKSSIRLFSERARADGYYRALIVGETKGNPSIIRVLDLRAYPFRWMGQLYISEVSLLLDIGKRPQRVDEDDLIVEVDHEMGLRIEVAAVDGTGNGGLRRWGIHDDGLCP